MTDNTPRPAPTRYSPSAKLALAIITLIVWSIFAGQWADRGCDRFPQGYSLVLFHGTPDRWEGCEDEPGGPIYTDRYEGN